MNTGRAEARSRPVNSNINVTPLCDVMLVLLIIFMVVTPLLVDDVPVRLPDASYSTEHPDDDETLTLSYQGNRSLFLGSRPIEYANLNNELRREAEARADSGLFIRAARSLAYSDVLELMAACRRVGFEEIVLITSRESEFR